MSKIEVCLNGQDWIEVNDKCVDYIYEDEMPTLFVIIDELAELTLMSKATTEEQKITNQKKGEILTMIQSIAQLGRAANVFVVVATQKPNADVIPTVLRSNLTFRAYCGKASEAGASTVTLGNDKAMLVDNSRPGMAVVQAGNDTFTRVYYSEFADLYEYYRKRGLDNKGYSELKVDYEEDSIPITGTMELDFDGEEKVFEFETEKAVIDLREDQKWEEV